MAISVVQVVLVSIEEYTMVPAQQDGGIAFAHVLQRCPVAILLFFYFIGITIFTGSLASFHSYLICTNQTTYENIKKRNRNMYTKGVLGNWKEFLFMNRWPRALSIRNRLPEPVKLNVEV
jgi:palmitoyltransferase ZDHHC9/14/18